MCKNRKIELFYKGLKTEEIMNDVISCIDDIIVLEERVAIWKKYGHHTAEVYSKL